MPAARAVIFLIGREHVDRKAKESLGIELCFLDEFNRESLDRQFFWAEFDNLYEQTEKRVIEMRANPGTRKEPELLKMLMPATRKDEPETLYVLKLEEAEKLMRYLVKLKGSKPEIVEPIPTEESTVDTDAFEREGDEDIPADGPSEVE